MVKVFLVGNLTRDPEARETQQGKAVSFTVAVNRRGKKQEGQPDADFYRVTAWRALGENCLKYLAKGRKAAVSGGLQMQSYAGRDGKERTSPEVTADEVEFLSPKEPAMTVRDAQPGFVQVDDDELPF